MQVTDKIEVVRRSTGETAYYFQCPGCQEPHAFTNAWAWNGDTEHPTFAPSLLVNASRPECRCHLYVREGRIEYLPDSHHALAGQTVEMTEVSQEGQ